MLDDLLYYAGVLGLGILIHLEVILILCCENLVFKFNLNNNKLQAVLF